MMQDDRCKHNPCKGCKSDSCLTDMDISEMYPSSRLCCRMRCKDLDANHVDVDLGLGEDYIDGVLSLGDR